MFREIAVEWTNQIKVAAGGSVSWHVRGDQTPRSADTRTSGFTGPMRAMHWITVVLVLGTYSAAWMIDADSSSAEADWLVMLHRSFGVMILLITALRLALRQYTVVPKLPPDLPAVLCFAARANANLLYVLLILQIGLGLIGSMLHGDRIVLFGNAVLPIMLPVNRMLARTVFRIHGVTALLLLALIGLHVAAALYHHFVRKDEVMAGMLPRVRGRPRSADLAPGRLPDGGRRQP
jgi:cytochrome b561